MAPKLSPDVERPVCENPTGVIRVEGTSGTYYVMTEEATRVRQYVLEGLEEADRGEVSAWNTAEIIDKATRSKEQRPT